MAKTVEFKYAPMFQVGEDKTEYRLLSKEGVTTAEFEGKTIVKVSKEALTLLAQQAFHDVEFMLRREHNEQVAKIITDPEASENDKMMDCINHFKKITNELPASETAFNIAKEGLTKQLASLRTTKMGIINRWHTMKELGLDFDLNKKIYEDLSKVTLQDIVNFEKANMAQKPLRYLILGDEKELDVKVLEKIGPIKRLTTEDIFGY